MLFPYWCKSIKYMLKYTYYYIGKCQCEVIENKIRHELSYNFYLSHKTLVIKKISVEGMFYKRKSLQQNTWFAGTPKIPVLPVHRTHCHII